VNLIDTLWPWLPLLGRGLLLNLGMGALAMALAALLGTLLGAAQLAPSIALSRAARWLTQLLRNAPWLVVMFFVMQLLPYELAIGSGWPLPAWMKAVLALTLPATGNFAEIVRGGLRAIPLAQWEAATALGYSAPARLRYVILPQALRNMTPVLLTQSIVMLQDTSLVYVVGLRDFLTSADIVASRDNRPTELYMFVALVFLVVCFSASRLVNRLRRRYAL